MDRVWARLRDERGLTLIQRYLAPYFIDPVKSAWKVTTWSELPGQSL